MNLLPWILVALVVVAVTGLAVVPWFRAEPRDGVEEGRWSVEEVERQLHREYCLECGQRFESSTYNECPACGAARPAVWP
jgi:hypothetical protein